MLDQGEADRYAQWFYDAFDPITHLDAYRRDLAIKFFCGGSDQHVPAEEAKAQYCVGKMYHKGQGAPEDDLQAVAWYREAADQGYAKAQTNLGWMYANGHGLEQDYVRALASHRPGAAGGARNGGIGMTDRAWVLSGGFGIDNLRVEARAPREPGVGEARVRIEWVSLNRRDLLLIDGVYNPRQNLPVVNGRAPRRDHAERRAILRGGLASGRKCGRGYVAGARDLSEQRRRRTRSFSTSARPPILKRAGANMRPVPTRWRESGTGSRWRLRARRARRSA